MSERRFYIHCREGGIKLTLQDAAFMRNAWISTFTEMQQHMQPEQIYETSLMRSQLGMDGDEDEDEDDKGFIFSDRCVYRAQSINGMVRNRSTKNAACNFQFQSLVAYGAKIAGWKLVYNGFGNRVVNFVHDEYLYYLYPHELKQIPRIEKIMLDGMREAIPDVKLGVESSVMLHWDKKAIEYKDLEWDEDGEPIIAEPPYVQKMKEKKLKCCSD